ncbi:DUF4236 domain-containing protein [Clostridium aminobutyricum]|uniref:DUF4236 domain-containing protein n=1 Tax=Clostridium aminobutyricum TaxID=33953 RepID=A0A939D9T4_CLOAM|nr:DUF4236 domain-containing protein [Clostridium aminobutyricum]MBN7774039.1 DUF4236 domain-containing protein [Clostridium aminobutyricum]
MFLLELKGVYMGINYRKTKALSKNVRLTVSKNGPSISVGKKGARVSINKDGIRGSVGIPGSGLSYSKQKSFPKGSKVKKTASIVAAMAMVVIMVYLILR